MTRPRRSAAVTAAGALAVAAAIVALWATPAGADPPQPTNYRSEVVEVEPPLPPGVAVRVVGGDSFLELRVAGHEVTVPDYGESQQPYLRFAPDGTVERNRSAVATQANERRYGTGEDADPEAPVRWEVVATDGRYAWHDHRIHWMARTEPRAVGPDGLVDLGGPEGRWEVDLVVDGVPTVVRGELRLLASPSPLPWLLLGGAAAIGTVATLGVLRATRPRWRIVLGAAAAVALGAVGVSAATVAAAPAGSGAPWWPLVVTAATAGAALIGTLGPPRLRLVAAAATAAGLVGWGALRASVLVHAVLPTTLPPGIDRAITTLALGVGLALAAGVLWRPPTDGQRAR